MPPPLTRRSLLGSALAAPVLSGASGAALALTAPDTQNAGWYRFGLGSFTITIASDGNLEVPTTTIGTNAPREAVVRFLQDRITDPATTYAHTNHVIIQTGTATVLVDVGSGDKFQPSAGRLVETIEAAGIAPGDITHVVLTHAHPDHVWGMMDDFGDAPRMPAATYTIGSAEFDWWMAKDRITQVPEVMQGMVVGAQNALRPVADRTTMVKGGAEVVPGVRLLATPGHTPGHMSVLVESDGQLLLVLGDSINHPHVSFEHPDWHFAFDIDADQAVSTRKRLLDMAATNRLAVAGYHLPFPGIGHVIKRGGAYRFLPEPWIWSQ